MRWRTARCIEPETPARPVGLVHLLTMLTTTLVFAATWIVQLGGYGATRRWPTRWSPAAARPR